MRVNILFIWFLLGVKISYAQQVNLEKYLPDNYVKNGTQDYTKYLQKGINENQELILPNFPVLINDKGLLLKDNQSIYFQESSKLIMKPNDKEKYALLHLNGIENVIIKNAHLEGDRDRHISENGQWGMGISILSSKNIQIINPVISKFWGDGIYISSLQNTKNKRKFRAYSEKVQITNGKLINNRRNGISVISAKDVLIDNLKTKINTEGYGPMTGVDIEPNNKHNVIDDIFIMNSVFEGGKSGVQIGMSKYTFDKKHKINIIMDSIVVKNNTHGIRIGSFNREKEILSKKKKLKGRITFSNFKVENYIEEPLKFNAKFKYQLAPELNFINLKVNGKKPDKRVLKIIKSRGGNYFEKS